MIEAAQESSVVPMDKLAKIYLKIRGRIQEVTQELEKQIDDLKEQQAEVANAMKEQMKALGVDSVKTAQGTVMLRTTTRYDTQDWDAFKSFVLETGAIDLFERRIAQTNMANYLAENPGLLPPGLNAKSEIAVSVRKPTAK